jgi:hypothetical protein
MVKIRLKTLATCVEEPILWNNIFPYGTVPIFVGKKRKHVIDLLSALELRGGSTTSELANFVIGNHYSKGELEKMGSFFVKRRGHYYWNHIYGFEKKTSGKKKIGTYDGLLEKGYVRIIEIKKPNVGIYFPTLLGHLVSLGYDYNYAQTVAFIKNASRNSLYFAFLNDIMNKVSFDFVKELFLNPIKKMIKQNRIRFDDDYRLNFDIIASATALKIREIIQKSEFDIRSKEPKVVEQEEAEWKLLKQLDILIQNTWFDFQYAKLEGKWVELYYPTEEQRWFYSQHCDLSDRNLIYKVMREIHVNYFGTYEQKIPPKHIQKFPFPIRRNRKKKTTTNSAFHNSMMAKKLRSQQILKIMTE